MSDDAEAAPADEERELRIELMKAQINLAKRQFQWEQWKGFATLIGGIAAFIGIAIAAGHLGRDSVQHVIVTQETPVVAAPAAPAKP